MFEDMDESIFEEVEQNSNSRRSSLDEVVPESAVLDSPKGKPSPKAMQKQGSHDVWRSVFHPGQTHKLKGVGSSKFDKVSTDSATVYDMIIKADKPIIPGASKD